MLVKTDVWDVESQGRQRTLNTSGVVLHCRGDIQGGNKRRGVGSWGRGDAEYSWPVSRWLVCFKNTLHTVLSSALCKVNFMTVLSPKEDDALGSYRTVLCYAIWQVFKSYPCFLSNHLRFWITEIKMNGVSCVLDIVFQIWVFICCFLVLSDKYTRGVKLVLW